MTVVGSNLPETPPEDFRILIKAENLPSDIYTYAKEDGTDIRFSIDEDGLEQLASEIVYFSSDMEESEIWVKLTGITNTSNFDFYMWYGNPEGEPYGDNHLFGRFRTWRDGFRGVYHLQDKVEKNVILAQEAEYDTLYNLVNTTIGGTFSKIVSFDRNGQMSFASNTKLNNQLLSEQIRTSANDLFVSNSAGTFANIVSDDKYGYAPVWVGNGYSIPSGFDKTPTICNISAWPASVSCVLTEVPYFTPDKQVLFFSGDFNTGKASYFIYKTTDNKIGVYSFDPSTSQFYEYRTEDQVFDFKEILYFGFYWDPPALPEIYIDGEEKSVSAVNVGQTEYYSGDNTFMIGDIPQKIFTVNFAGKLSDYKTFTGNFDEVRISTEKFSFQDEFVNYFSTTLLSAGTSEDIEYIVSFDILPSGKGSSIFYVTLKDTSKMPITNYTRTWTIKNTLDNTTEVIETTEASVNKAFRGKIEGQEFEITLTITI